MLPGPELDRLACGVLHKLAVGQLDPAAHEAALLHRLIHQAGGKVSVRYFDPEGAPLRAYELAVEINGWEATTPLLLEPIHHPITQVQFQTLMALATRDWARGRSAPCH